VVGDLEPQPRGDLALLVLDTLVRELLDPPAIGAHDVVVVFALVQFENSRAALEVMARDEPGGLELREHAVHGGEPDVLVGIEQAAVHVLGAHVTRLARRQDLEDLESRHGDLQAGTAQMRRFHCLPVLQRPRDLRGS